MRGREEIEGVEKGLVGDRQRNQSCRIVEEEGGRGFDVVLLTEEEGRYANRDSS